MNHQKVHEQLAHFSREIKLPYTLKHFKEELEEANKKNKTYETFLYDLLEKEYDLRKENGRKSRIRNARFPYKKYLEDLVIEDLPEDAQKKVKIFSTLKFIETGQNIILAGNPGTGNYEKQWFMERNEVAALICNGCSFICFHNTSI
ncbi:IstB-like ATP binding protein [Tindallia magadiensis]|uniref:IstB-like ATP binding protein n=1 Tax=Tindallia magadiensis TaxID=69895 RepID=A0A1I3I0I6_9FIRM|nr:ATP-binding protein [Tindallia magadiensis]SFI41402.1 IstB-like ATP binding protein [Tindallia magadiensis]